MTNGAACPSFLKIRIFTEKTENMDVIINTPVSDLQGKVKKIVAHLLDTAEISEAARLRIEISEYGNEAKAYFCTEQEKETFLAYLSGDLFDTITPGTGNIYETVVLTF
jgi:hypothetical protein